MGYHDKPTVEFLRQTTQLVSLAVELKCAAAKLEQSPAAGLAPFPEDNSPSYSAPERDSESPDLKIAVFRHVAFRRSGLGYVAAFNAARS